MGSAVSVLARDEAPASAEPEYGEVVRAFQEIGDAITGEVELDRLLHTVVRKVCELVGVRRGSLYLRDPETGLFHGQVGVALTDVDARVKQLTCGVEADGFTQEILATRAPVFIADARRDPRPIRSTMYDWEVRSILGVPMIAGGEVRGLLFLDDMDRPHHFSAAHRELAAAFANMAAVAITTAQRTADLCQSVRMVARQNNLLRRAAAMEERLTTLALRSGTVRDMAGILAELVDKPCAVHDASFGRIAVGVPAGEALVPPRLMDADVRGAPEVRAALAGLPGRAPKILGPFPRAGMHRRCLVVPIAARDEIWGYLLVGEEKSRLSTMETLVASRAAAIIALNVSFQRSAAETTAYAREALVRRLIDDAGPSGAIVAQAEFHGLRPRAQYAVAILAGRNARPREFDATAVEQAAQRAGFPTVWLASAENGTLTMVVELDEQARGLRDRVESLASLLDDRGALQIAVSGVCGSIHDLASAHREAKQVLRILRTFADRDRSPAILTADELGPGCLLLAAADRADADRFVRTALGAVADVHDPKAAEVLQTLQVFLSESCGIRKAAARLQVHENTIRYRLGRLAAATGRDVLTDTRAQLDAQIALLILRLEGSISS